ncbi:MAG: hypothetical protein ACOCUR_01800 [Nanoarchaeota archaeon]
MQIFSQKVKISLKNTLPTYFLISLFTLFFLAPGTTMTNFSRFGESILSKIFFSLAFNLLYLIPQFTGIFIGLHLLKKKGTSNVTPEKAKWFLRIPAPVTVITTGILIAVYFMMGFFPQDVDVRNLYIILMIITSLNLMFALVMTINIYAVMKNKMRKIGDKK